MHVLIVPSELYLPAWRHTSGIFQRHAAAALTHEGHRVGVLSAGYLTIPNVPRALRAAVRGGVGVDAPAGAQIVRAWIPLPLPYRWLPPRTFRGPVELAARGAFDRYVSRYGLPDLIHGHDPLWGGWIANMLARKSGRVSILTVHTSAFARDIASPRERELAGLVFNQADVVSAVSQSLAASLRVQFGIDEPAVLPNVVDEDFLKRLRAPRRAQPFVYFSAGSLDDNKNHALLLEAFAHCARGTAATLRIAGDGPRRNTLAAQARALGVESQVSFLGWVGKAGMLRELSEADCFVLSSRYETFGVVLIEALASGVPVVATRCGGPEDVVTAECGLIVEPENVAALAAAMQRIRDSHEAYNPESLKRNAARRFGPAAYVAQLMSLSGGVAPTKEVSG
jgi:glycosyltransferase involved in cell wall biosynthesis